MNIYSAQCQPVAESIHIWIYTAAFVLSFLFHLSLLYCHYCSVMPVSAYMALAFVFGFIQINLRHLGESLGEPKACWKGATSVHFAHEKENVAYANAKIALTRVLMKWYLLSLRALTVWKMSTRRSTAIFSQMIQHAQNRPLWLAPSTQWTSIGGAALESPSVEQLWTISISCISPRRDHGT